MTTVRHKILLKAETKSRAKILGKKLKSFIVGQKFTVTYNLTNMGSSIFPGGAFSVRIEWPNGQVVGEDYTIPRLKPNETHITHILVTDALSSGYSLFVLDHYRSNDNKPTDLLKAPREALALKPNSFHSILVKEPEEIYEFWGMVISAFSLLFLLIIELFRLAIGR